MDRELLNAFNNLSVALQNLADNLEKNAQRTEKSESMIADSLSKFDVTEQIKSIDEGIKKITQSNAEIIGQQKQILQALSKKEPKKAPDTEKISVQKKLTDIVQKIFKKQQDDSKKIQTTNDAVTKQKKTSPEYVPDNEQKKKITDGVKMILLMAAGILAIGIAFKVIGKVNFLSVIALAIALPLVAIAFKKVAEMRIDTKFLLINLAGLIVFSAAMVAASYFFSRMRTITMGQALTSIMIAGAFAALSLSLGRLTRSIKNVDLKGLFLMPLVLVTASLAIMASSYILGGVRTITIGQAFTTILISIAFAALSLSIGKLTKSLKTVDLRGLIMMPLVLITASLAIAASSYILSAVMPVGFFQMLTSIAIAATFAVVSYSLAKIVDKVKDIDYKDIAKLPLILIAASAAILGSSFLLSGVKLISFRQFLTSIGIALVFIPISIALPFIAKAVKVVDIAKAALMPIVLVSMALAIMLSSKVLSEASEIAPGKLFNLVLQSITIAAVGVVMGLAYFALQKMGLASPSGLKTVIFGSIVILGIATTIMLTSKILSFGDYDNYPSLMWTLGSVASILAYGILIAVAGTVIVATGGVGALGVLAGALAIIAIAGTILAVDKILSEGKFTNYPSLAYAASVSLLLVVFGATMAASGLLLPAIALGMISVRLIAKSITSTADIISKGNYTQFPSLSYAASLSLLMLSFGNIMAASGVLLPLIALGKKSIGLVAESIKDSSIILSQGIYTGGPTEDWAKGVSLAIGAFAPVLSSFGVGDFLNSLFGISTDDASRSIRMISEAIVNSANIFAGAGGNWVMGPPVAWSESVGKAIAAFAPVFDKLDSSGLFAIFDFAKVAVMTDSIVAVTTGIIASAALFEIAGTAISYKSYPSLAWSEGVGKAIGAFAPVFDKLNSSGLFAIFDAVKVATMTAAIVATTTGIITSAGLFQLAGLQYTNYPKVEWSDGVSKAIQAFSPAMEWAAENSGWFSSGAGDLIDVILGMGTAITGVSLIMQAGKFNININPNYFPSMKEAFMSNFEIVKSARDSDIGASDILSLLFIAMSIKEVSLILQGGNYNIMGLDTYVPAIRQVYMQTFDILQAGRSIGVSDIDMIVYVAETIKDTSLEIAKGNYNLMGLPTYVPAIKRTFMDTFEILKIAREVDVSDIRIIVKVATAIKDVSLEIAKGKYDTVIPPEYGKNLINLFNDFEKVTKIVNKISLLDSLFAVPISYSIAKVSRIIDKGKYTTNIPLNYGRNLSSLFTGYKDVVDAVKSITPGFFSTVITKAGEALDSIFGIEREKITPETVAMNIVSLSKILSMGRYVKIPMDWMQSVYENMKQYMNVVDLMSGYGGEFEIFGISLSFGKGISRLTSDYDRLAQSIQSVATAVSNLDIDKMNTMRAMTGSVVLLSLMDPGQFESMMDALEEKSSVLGNIFSKLETGTPVASAMPAVRTAGTGVAGTTAEGGMDEVIKIMKSMAMSLGKISSNSTNISNYVNQLRTSGKGPSLSQDS